MKRAYDTYLAALKIVGSSNLVYMNSATVYNT